MRISEITGEMHRRSVMNQIQAHSAVKLGGYAEQLDSDKLAKTQRSKPAKRR